MSIANAPRDEAIAARIGQRRRQYEIVARGLAWFATLVSISFLISILATLIWLGARGLSLHALTVITKSPGAEGGLANAIIGSLAQSLLGALFGTPIGLMVGTYLAEYAGQTTLGNAVRFVSDILLSAPSILIGLFIYQVMVVPMGGFSGWAGGAALGVIVIPIVVRTTEDMLRLVPVSLREAAIALGAPRWKTIVFVCYRAAKQGIVTGILLAVARIAGETAPLLFTSFGNSDFSSLNGAFSSLPITIYQYAASAFDDWVALAWTGALLITLGVLAINILARTLMRSRV
jgi:phosphate transport system permease protein